MNRLAYLATFIYWLLRHRNWDVAKWVTEFEGRTWK